MLIFSSLEQLWLFQGRLNSKGQLSTFLHIDFLITVLEVDKNWAVLDDSKLNWKQLNERVA